MDRDGKKPKPNRAGDAPNAQRSDTKARAREASARPDADSRLRLGLGAGTAQGAPATPGRKEHRG
jgi:hypothetical protein